MALRTRPALTALIVAHVFAIPTLGAQPVDAGPAPRPSRIRADERVVFFPTFGFRIDDGWRISVHGWIYEPEADSAWRSGTVEAFGRALGLTAEQRASPSFVRRAQRFIADNERGKRIGVRIGGDVHVMQPSEPNGHFLGEIVLTEREARTLADERGRVTLSPVNAAEGAGVNHGAAFLFEPEGLTVVSDIDDTIKISEVGDTRRLLERALAEPYEPAPGMPDLFRRLAEGGADFHYLSASPWQLYEPLSDFLHEHGFPSGPTTLRSIRLKDQTGLNLLRSPGPFKREALREIMSVFPERRLVLIGDTSEDDAEVFADAAAREPDRVIFVAIRAAPSDGKGERHAREALASLAADRWVVFSDPRDIPVERILAAVASEDADR